MRAAVAGPKGRPSWFPQFLARAALGWRPVVVLAVSVAVLGLTVEPRARVILALLTVALCLLVADMWSMPTRSPSVVALAFSLALMATSVGPLAGGLSFLAGSTPHRAAYDLGLPGDEAQQLAGRMIGWQVVLEIDGDDLASFFSLREGAMKIFGAREIDQGQPGSLRIETSEFDGDADIAEPAEEGAVSTASKSSATVSIPLLWVVFSVGIVALFAYWVVAGLRAGRVRPLAFSTPAERLAWMRAGPALRGTRQTMGQTLLASAEPMGRATTWPSLRNATEANRQARSRANRAIRRRSAVNGKTSNGWARQALAVESDLQQSVSRFARPATQATNEPGHLPGMRTIWWNADCGIQVVVGGVDYCSDVGRHNPTPSGYRFVAFAIGVENLSTGNIHVNPMHVTMVDQMGLTYACHGATHSASAIPLGPVDVRPGDRTHGHVVFLISASVPPARIIYRTPTSGAEVVVNVEEESPALR